MLSTLGRYSTLGVYVTFRLEGTEEFLWKAPMMYVPKVNEHVGHLEGEDEVSTWYKVEDVRYEFARDPSTAYGDPPVEFVPDHSYFGVYCLVSEV